VVPVRPVTGDGDGGCAGGIVARSS